MTIITRFPPSPTGYLHIGGARTALFNWLYARQQKGEFVLRIEDTDQERSTDVAVQAIFDGMHWLNLEHDQGPFFQMQRLERYKDTIQQLLDSGDAYYCTCSKERLDALREEQMSNKQKPKYDGKCRDANIKPSADLPAVIRFKNPLQGEVVINDLVKGDVVINNSELDDLVIARPDGTPTYHLTVVVDDWDMKITHVIRGDDHLSNTPRQINILKALGAPLPLYGHVPMILGGDGKRLSKRHSAVNLMDYAKQGFLPQALLNYLVRLGWSHGDQEIFSIDEMIELFSIEAINKSPATFDIEKLKWVNAHYLRTEPVDIIAKAVTPFLQELGLDVASKPVDMLHTLIPIIAERSHTLVDLAAGMHYFYQAPTSYDAKAAKKHLHAEAPKVFEALKSAFSTVDTWNAQDIHAAIKDQAQQLDMKMGKIGMPLRVAMTGAGQSPDIGLTLELIGKQEVLSRLSEILKWLAE